MATRVIDDTKLNDIAVAIQAKDSGGQMTVDEMAGRIEALPVPLPNVEEKDVNFFNHKGELLYTYTKNEFQQLTELPPLPTLDGFTVQSWAYTLTEINTFLNAGNIVDVGAYYVTSNGSTRLILKINSEELLFPSLHLRFRSGTLTILVNGVVTTQVTETSSSMSNHTIDISLPASAQYPAIYIIDLFFDGTSIALSNNDDTGIFGDDCRYRNSLILCSLAENKWGIERLGLSKCLNLRSLLFPQDYSIYQLSNACIDYAINLKGVTLAEFGMSYNPFNYSGLKYCCMGKLNGAQFGNCLHLKHLCILDSFTTIGGTFAYQNLSLEKIIIPKTVTSINGSSAFTGCISLTLIDLTAFDDPNNILTLSNINALQNTPSSQIIYVKNQEMYDAFTTATNWSTYANRFEIKEVTT